jgi:replicative superfamily II helicase
MSAGKTLVAQYIVAAHSMALAKEIEEDDPALAALAALASTLMNPAHPLVGVLRRGVGFHHAALPGDIQAEQEDGIRKGPLRQPKTDQLAARENFGQGVS